MEAAGERHSRRIAFEAVDMSGASPSRHVGPVPARFSSRRISRPGRSFDGTASRLTESSAGPCPSSVRFRSPLLSRYMRERVVVQFGPEALRIWIPAPGREGSPAAPTPMQPDPYPPFEPRPPQPPAEPPSKTLPPFEPAAHSLLLALELQESRQFAGYITRHRFENVLTALPFDLPEDPLGSSEFVGAIPVTQFSTVVTSAAFDPRGGANVVLHARGPTSI
jgi:hypothetical protein